MALGKYKISAIEDGVEQAYFYMDWRTSDYGASMDVYFKYDVANNHFRNNENTQAIDGTTQTVWDLVSGIDHVTTGLEPYAPINTIASNYLGRSKITWARQSIEDYITGYEIYRSFDNPFNYSKIATVTNTYYIDYDVSVGLGGIVYYKVKAINGSKTSDFSNSTSINYKGINKGVYSQTNTNQTINTYSLSQNCPNPFNPVTEIKYSIKDDSHVRLRVYAVNGVEIESLVEEYQVAGNYSINFDASNLPSGVYIYILETEKFTAAKKLTLLK